MGAAPAAAAEAAIASWEDPPRGRAPTTSPILAVDGFEGPLDWLLEMARARKIDLARLSILALVEAFAGAMDLALTRGPDGPAPDLARWAAWTVMAAQLTELRSRLLLPADTPEARTAQAQAEALRRQWVTRTQMAAGADWLERQPQLGSEVFARGRPEVGTGGAAQGPACANTADAGLADTARAGPGAGLAQWQGQEAAEGELSHGANAMTDGADDRASIRGDITELLRACLVALRLPPHATTYQPRRLPFWGIGDAAARITRLSKELPTGATLEAFVPDIAAVGPGRALHCRAAVAATLIAGLELTRNGAINLEQDALWQPIQVQHRDGSLSHSPIH